MHCYTLCPAGFIIPRIQDVVNLGDRRKVLAACALWYDITSDMKGGDEPMDLQREEPRAEPPRANVASTWPTLKTTSTSVRLWDMLVLFTLKCIQMQIPESGREGAVHKQPVNPFLALGRLKLPPVGPAPWMAPARPRRRSKSYIHDSEG